MRMILISMYVAIVAAISACAQPSSMAALHTELPKLSEQARVANEYLVTLAPDTNEKIIPEYYGRFGIKYVHALEEETYLLVVSIDPGPQRMEDLIQNEPHIKVVQPNLIQWHYK